MPSEQEIQEAIRRSTKGNRIGDEADTMQAELTAILTYLQQIASQADAGERRVLIMSDCLNALRAIEETWRGEGAPYRQRSGGGAMEAINTLREQLERVVFIYVPSHSGVVPNAYADGIAKAYLNAKHKLRTGTIIAKGVRTRRVVHEKKGSRRRGTGERRSHVSQHS